MAEIATIRAEARERAGKGAARATRRAGRVPAAESTEESLTRGRGVAEQLAISIVNVPTSPCGHRRDCGICAPGAAVSTLPIVRVSSQRELAIQTILADGLDFCTVAAHNLSIRRIPMRCFEPCQPGMVRANPVGNFRLSGLFI